MKLIWNIIQVFAFCILGITSDIVYSYDTITGTVEQKEVTAVFVLESDHLNYLTIVDENNNVQVIETTDSHPFWVVTDEPDLERAARSVVDENGVWLYHENVGPTEHGYWVEAKDLREGDVFLGANGELSTLVVAERVVFPDGVKVYNFTVDGNHDYFVIAQTDEFGQTCVLVHNNRICRPNDVHLNSENEALQEALRRHGVPERNFDLIERIPVYGKNNNLKGPKKEPSEIIQALDAEGNLVQIKHHKWGHTYDWGSEAPHYHGPAPDSVHIFYPGG